MVTSSITPTYYRVTVNGAAPNNFNALVGDSAGGLDNTTPERYNRIVRVVGTDAAVSVTGGHSIRINDVEVTFDTNPSILADVITAINALSQEHGVLAYVYDTNYVGLANNWSREGEPIWLASGTGTALTDMGLSEGVYAAWPSVFGTDAPALPGAGDDIKINGVTVTFGAGDVGTISAVCTKINTLSLVHGVLAQPAGGGIQLSSTNGQPFALSNGTLGVVTDLGLAVGNQGGSPVTLAQALDKERANMRWDALVFELGQLISPVFLGEVVKTGNIDGTAPVTSLSFTVGYDRASYLRMEDSTSPGTFLTGVACIKRLVALALVQGYSGNQEIMDPTVTTTGDTCARLNPLQILTVVTEGVTADVTVAEQNITVAQLPLV
jgi:hypothetical protein